MNTELSLQEKDLELVVSEKTLGSLTTNAKQIRDMVKNALPMYDISNYNDDNIEQAKKDKAALNKAAKSLNSKRIEFEKEFMIPFSEFKEVVSETVQLISECSSKIDNVVKQNEQAYKDTKKAAIIDYFEANNANLVDFNKIFKEAWLNKTVKEKNVFTDIDNILAGIESDIKTIESMTEDADVLRTYYLDTLNINNTIQYGNRLKEQKERAKAAEEARQKAEEERLRIHEEAKQQASNQQPVTPTPSNPFAGYTATNKIPFEEVVFKESPKSQPELLTRAFKVTTTRDNIIALGDFMNEKGINFDKIELP
jgi:hypothetical protein